METEDLIIRDSIWDDIDSFYQWELKPEVNEFFSISENQSFEMVARTYIQYEDDPDRRQYTIVLKETGKPIGRIMLGGLIEGWKIEVFRVYIGDPALRNKGYGRQAMKAVMKLCFEEWNLERVYLDHYTGNPASNLYLSLGFKYEGVLRNNCKKNGKLYDVHLMSMLKNEYIQKLGLDS